MTLASRINLVDPLTGQRFPSAPDQAVVLSSTQSGWRQDVTLEVHRLMPMELPEHYIEGHRLIINLGGSVRFGWRTNFKAIEQQFGLQEKQVIALMRREMKASSFKMWRERVTGRKTKHFKQRDFVSGRFHSLASEGFLMGCDKGFG